MPMHNMTLHADLSLRAVVRTAELEWQPSPEPGVQRRLVERNGGEVARASSVVRYAAGASFAQHTHGLGEEVFVLEGSFEDEHGTYASGTYLKTPPGSSHRPRSPEGCTLFVKLAHMRAADQTRTVVRTAQQPWFAGLVSGPHVMPLSAFSAAHTSEHTALVRWAPGTVFNPHRHFGGEEIFVIDGVFEDEHGVYPTHSWIRSPHLSAHRPFSKAGCTIWVKTGHLI